MEQHFTIPFKLPSLNDYINACRTNPYKAAGFKKRTEREITACFAGLRPVKRPCIVEMRFWEPDMRRDVDNVESAKKYILDALVARGILQGDSPKWVKAVPSYTEYKGNRVEVFLREEAADEEAAP